MPGREAPDGERAIPYFPKSEGISIAFKDTTQLPERPHAVGPIFDTDKLHVPIKEFDPVTHSTNYAEQPDTREAPPTPPMPPNFSDPYLYPSLTRHERLRLTMIWYLTRQMMEDKELLVRLQEKVDMVQEFIGWEFTIMGILDNYSYTRVVTAGLPLAILPRRESTCSHTINQPSGTVFMLPEMGEDWRFKHSPHVEVGGLRSYAGTQLRYRTESGLDIAIGSLCVASNSSGQVLSPSKQTALVRFADMLTQEIVNKLRMDRQRQRHRMSELVAEIKSYADADQEVLERVVMECLHEIYPQATISLQTARDGYVHIEGRGTVLLSQVRDGLWEDAALIDQVIIESNHEELHSQLPVRAVIGRCSQGPLDRVVIVVSRDMQLIFDDIDAWFVERCSLVFWGILQERSLKEALQAKQTFLRGITHQLRTPIHGVLGSVDLLAEELAARNLLDPVDTHDEAHESARPHNTSAVLTTIRNSGRELMSTVNNMLKLNRWAEMSESATPNTLQDLALLESDLLAEIAQMIPEDEPTRVTIMVDNELAPDVNMIVMDVVLLKECLQSLILNAIQFTTYGSVIVTISASPDYSTLRFDVKDTGCGISPQDHLRIFEAYEKADMHTRGAGLGLTLASKIATAMNGEVTLVASQPGQGSHFRAEFADPAFGCATRSHTYAPAELKWLPKKYTVVQPDFGLPVTRHFVRYLERRGFTSSERPTDSLHILTLGPDPGQNQKLLSSLDATLTYVCLVSLADRTKYYNTANPRLMFFSGPFVTSGLDEILHHADELFHKLPGDLQNGDRKPSATALLEARLEGINISKGSGIDSPPVALLVDDNLINLRIMRMYCEKRKIPYEVAVDGQEAVEKFKASLLTRPINLVLMDLQMPNMDGVQACTEIRALEAGSALDRSVIFIGRLDCQSPHTFERVLTF